MVSASLKYLIIALGLFALPLGAITKEERIQLLGESAKGMIAPQTPQTLQEPPTAKVETVPQPPDSTDLKKFEESIPVVSEESSPLKNLEKAVQSVQSTALIDSIIEGLNRVAALQTLYYRQSLKGTTALETKSVTRSPKSKNLDPLTASAYNPPSK